MCLSSLIVTLATTTLPVAHIKKIQYNIINKYLHLHYIQLIIQLQPPILNKIISPSHQANKVKGSVSQ